MIDEWIWDECHKLTVATIVLFGTLAVVVSVQLGRIIYNGHNVMSFNFGFCVLVLLWMYLRTIFFLSLTFSPIPVWLDRLLYWPTTNLQLATYTLLICFFARYVHRDTWRSSTKRKAVIWFIASNVVSLLFTIGWLIAAGNTSENDVSHAMILAQIFYTGTIFLLITIVMGYYGWKFITIVDQMKNRGSTLIIPSGGSMNQIRFFYVVALLIFSFRYIYDFSSVNVDFTQVPFGVENKCVPDVLTFFVLVIWEMIPPAMVLYFFRRIPKKARFRNPRVHSQGAPFLDPSPSSSSTVARGFFDAPYMYDSEEDQSVVGDSLPATNSHFKNPEQPDNQYFPQVSPSNQFVSPYGVFLGGNDQPKISVDAFSSSYGRSASIN